LSSAVSDDRSECYSSDHNFHGISARLACGGNASSGWSLLHPSVNSASAQGESGDRQYLDLFSEGVSSYHSLQVDLRHRFSHGLLLRGVYTFAKTLDDGDSLNQTTAGNAPGLVSNPLNLAADKGWQLSISNM